ncbi:putative helicase/DNA methyltransferase [Helicobacter pylori Hp P-2b]|nr:putative helicase/DNA methyltransferase [Helicobacter pylori Hp P-2b]
MAYKPSKKKLQTLREEPNLFSILDNGNIATNNPVEESDKTNEIQEPLPYVVKTQINRASMINRNPIEWAKYLSFEKRIYKDNSKEDVNFFANGEIKESSRVYEANKEGFERRIIKRYDLIDTINNKEFFSKEIEILTYTNSLEELKDQGLEIQLTHHNETHKKTLENGNEIAKEYDYLKDIYQEVERTKDGKLVREIIPHISSDECFKLYNKLPFESINNENTKLNTNNTIKNTIETNTSNNIIKNNDNNHPNLSLADLELEQQNLGEPNGKERTNRADEPSRARAGIPQEIHRRSEPRGQQEGVERSSDEELLHQDPSLFIEPREQGGTRGVYRSSDQQAVSKKSHRERDRLHEHVSRGDGVSARADARANSNGASSPASRMENGTRSEEKGDNPNDERGVSRTPQSPSHQQNSSRDLGLSLSREQPGQTGRLRLFDHGQMGSLFPTDHENQEKGAIMSLIDAVIKQTKMETEALDRMEAQIKRAQGVSDMELLQEAQINQYYHLLKADYIMQDLAHQMDLETLKKTGIKREDFYQI